MAQSVGQVRNRRSRLSDAAFGGVGDAEYVPGPGADLSFLPGTPYLERAFNLLCYAILIVGIGTMFCAAYLMKTAYSIVPGWDDWKVLDGYVHRPHLEWLWEQLNEHRIIYYKLLLMGELRFFRGSNWPAYIAIFCCQIAVCILFGYMLRRFGKLKGPFWAACFGLALYTYFCPCQWENFGWGIQFSFMLVSVWMMIALVGVLLQGQRIASGQAGGRGVLAISLLAAVGATFCGANGIVVWMVALLAAIYAGLPRRVIVCYLVGMLVVSPLYFIGYHSPPTHPPPLATLHQPLGVLEYMEKLFGSTLLPRSQFDWAVQVGQLALLLSLFLLVRFLVHGRRQNLLEVGLAGITFYTLATAFLMALGRLILGTDQAFTPRYQTFALQLWLAISVWTILIAVQHRAARSLTALLLATAALLISSIRLYEPVLDLVRNWVFEQRESAGPLLITDIHDDDFVRTRMFRQPELVWSDAEYLRARRLSVFSTAMSRQMGTDLTPTYTVVPSSNCIGYVDKITKVGVNGEGLKLDGWAVNRPSNNPVRKLLLVAGTRIVGFGVSGVVRSDVAAALHSKRAWRSGWVGYARAPDGATALEVYGVPAGSPGNAACLVETVQLSR
jgi:hypothetical protein